MDKDLLHSINALIEATSHVYITHDGLHKYSVDRSDGIMNMQVAIGRKAAGRLKGFLISEHVVLREFMDTIINAELDRIEQERGIKIKEVDPHTRLHYGINRAPEQKLHTIINRFRDDLTKLSQVESQSKELNEEEGNNGQAS